MQGLVLGDLSIEVVERTAGEIELHWTGASNNRDPSATLRPWFELLVAEAISRRLRVMMHFEKLKHFNSSTVAALLLFAHDASQRGVGVTFHYDPAQRWQAHSFLALERLQRNAPGIEVVRIGGGTPAEVIGEP